MKIKKNIEKTYKCNVCKETYNGIYRKWTCPICGNPDTFDCTDNYKDKNYDYDDFDYEEDIYQEDMY